MPHLNLYRMLRYRFRLALPSCRGIFQICMPPERQAQRALFAWMDHTPSVLAPCTMVLLRRSSRGIFTTPRKLLHFLSQLWKDYIVMLFQKLRLLRDYLRLHYQQWWRWMDQRKFLSRLVSNSDTNKFKVGCRRLLYQRPYHQLLKRHLVALNCCRKHQLATTKILWIAMSSWGEFKGPLCSNNMEFQRLERGQRLYLFQ